MNTSDLIFKNGMKLSHIVYSTKECLYHDDPNVVDMWVIIENGQMAGVPWAVVEFNNGQIIKINLATALEVGLLISDPVEE